MDGIRYSLDYFDMKTLAAEIPLFALYGEQSGKEHSEFVHIEQVETRSRLYDWHIGTHTHAG
jgi:AraC family transcriptional activator of pobA